MPRRKKNTESSGSGNGAQEKPISSTESADRHSPRPVENQARKRKSRCRRKKSKAITLNGENSQTSTNSNSPSRDTDGRKNVLETIMSKGLSSFKIPKMKSMTSKDNKNTSIPQISSNLKSNDTAIKMPDVGNSERRKRKSEAINDDGIKKVTKIHPGSSSRTSQRQTESVNADLETNKEHAQNINSKQSTRPKLVPKRTRSASIVPQKDIIDTPQMAALKKLMQERKQKAHKVIGRGLKTKTEIKNDGENTTTSALSHSFEKNNVCTNTSRHSLTVVKDKCTPKPSTSSVASDRKIYDESRFTNHNDKDKGRQECATGITGNYTARPLCQFTSASNDVNRATVTPVRNHEGFTNHVTTNLTNHVPEILQIVRSSDHSNSQLDQSDVMDVDVFQVEPIEATKVFVIIDTNIWISHQSVISQILDMTLPCSTGMVQAIVIIPWMVLQEIDYNIHRKTSAATCKFRDASKFIHGLLSAKHPRVKGEKASDAIIGMDFNELMADDSILNCAIQYSKSTKNRVAFITNDINLLNKALVHNLDAFKVDPELINNLRKLSSHSDTVTVNQLDESVNIASNCSFSQPTSPFLHTTFQNPSANTSNNQFNNTLENIEMDVDDPMGNENSIIGIRSGSASYSEQLVQPVLPTFEAVASALQQTLTSIIVPKMVEEYGKDGWKFAIKIKPPFTVESAVKCIHAHWIAVFSFIFSSRGKEVVDELVNVFQQKPRSGNEMDFKSWRLKISQMAKILLTLNNNIANRPRVVDCCHVLQEYIQYQTLQTHAHTGSF